MMQLAAKQEDFNVHEYPCAVGWLGGGRNGLGNSERTGERALSSLVKVVHTSAITRAVAPVSNDVGAVTDDLQSIIDETIEAELKDAGEYVAGAAKGFTPDGIEVSTQVRQGVVGDELNKAIDEAHIDAVVVAPEGARESGARSLGASPITSFVTQASGVGDFVS